VSGVCSVGRIALAISPSVFSSTLYAGIQDARNGTFGSLLGFFKSTDGGKNWFHQISTPNYCGNSTGGSCWYNNVVRVHPANPNIVFAGGDCCTHLIVSFDGATTWTKIGSELHPDTHTLAFSGDGAKLYVGNDGGAYSTSNTTSLPVSFVQLNNALATIQFYPGNSIDVNNVNNAFGGTQDNSTERYSGTLTWGGVTCGDGGFTAIDPVMPNNVYTTCAGMDIEKSTSGGTAGTWSTVKTGIVSTDRSLFIPPLAIDMSSPLRLYFGTFRIYQTMNGAGSWGPISPDLTSGGTISAISAIAVAPSDSNTVYAGSSDGRVQVTTNAGSGSGATWADRTPGLPLRYVTQIAVDPHVSTTVYATFSGFNAGHLFESVNGGVNWTNLSGNLPNIPVDDLVVDPLFQNSLYAATDIGVFQSTDGGATWTVQVGGPGPARPVGLPSTPVLGLKLHNATRTLRAATHGRSMWDTHLPTADLALTKQGPSLIRRGAKITYTMTVVNNGLDAATGVVLTDPLPLRTTFVAFTTSTGSCTAPPVGSTGTLNCNLGSLSNGGSATVTLTVQPPLKGRVVNTATVSASAPRDPNTANNTATVTTSIF
jgi:uncharacterized repeat protein (TIGR01451 family)